MQIFVPHDTFAESVRVLDNKRLGKQRVETYQIVLVLLGLGPVKDTDPVEFTERLAKGWRRHPAVLAWQDNIGALLHYQYATCREWTRRGFNDTCADKTTRAFKHAGYRAFEINLDKPEWWGREDVHASHRSNLLRKDPVWYGQFGWTEPHDLEYVWPSRETVVT